MHRAVATGSITGWEWMSGRVEDSYLASGRQSQSSQVPYMLRTRFSYPTTITMSFFRAGYAVVSAHPCPKRIGKQHMRIVRDG